MNDAAVARRGLLITGNRLSDAAIQNYIINKGVIKLHVANRQSVGFLYDEITELALDQCPVPDLSPCVKLERLTITNYIVEYINVSRLVNLRYLCLSHLDLTSPPDLQGLVHLQIVELSHNKLTELPDFSDQRQLKDLYASNNQLSTLPTLKTMEKLFLCNNAFKDAPDVSSMTKLQWLNMHGNLMKQPPNVSSLAMLHTLVLSKNQLTSPPDVAHLPYLIYLDLTDNPKLKFPKTYQRGPHPELFLHL